MTRTTSRRSILRGAAAAPALFLAARQLHAAGETARAAPRFIFIYTPAGRVPSWRTDTVGRNYKLGPTMTMFEPYRERMAILDGFTTINFGYGINAHWGPLHQMLGGKAPLRRPGDQGGALSVGSQRSFDHLLADRIGRYSPVRSIVIGGRDRDNGKGSNSLIASWTGPGVPQFPVHDPDQTLTSLFGGGDADALSALRDPDAIRRGLTLETRMLGLSRVQLASWKKRLGRAEGRQLEAYESHLRGLYDQVVSESPELIAEQNAQKCAVPSPEELERGLPNAEVHARHHDLQSRILAAALACGRTRVATYVMASIHSKMTLPGSPEPHHYHNDSAVEHYEAFDRYYGDRIKFLLDELARYPEGEGTVLDNTVLLWTTDIAWTPIEHDQDSIPIYLMGGLPGGRLKLGQYIKVPYDDCGGDRVKALASPNNRRLPEVLLTLASAIGQRDFTGFADEKVPHGLVQELLA